MQRLLSFFCGVSETVNSRNAEIIQSKMMLSICAMRPYNFIWVVIHLLGLLQADYAYN